MYPMTERMDNVAKIETNAKLIRKIEIWEKKKSNFAALLETSLVSDKKNFVHGGPASCSTLHRGTRDVDLAYDAQAFKLT